MTQNPESPSLRLSAGWIALRLGVGLGAAAGGVLAGSLALGALGLACLLHVPLNGGLHYRIRSGFGNQGLLQEFRRNRLTGYVLRGVALCLGLASAAAIFAQRGPEPSPWGWGIPLVAFAAMVPLWLTARPFAEHHPSLAMETLRSRALAEGAALALVGGILGTWFWWGDAAAGLALALRLEMEARTLGALTSVKAACGGCGGGCGCG